VLPYIREGAVSTYGWIAAPQMIEITCGVVGLMFSISIPLGKIAFMRHGSVDRVTVLLGLAAFVALTFWKWRLNVVVVVLAGGALGLLRAFAPGLFGGAVLG
jgi:chromate transporter